MAHPKIKALIVDDTILYRKILSDTLSAIPGVEVIGTAGNGRIALSRIKQLKPDFITLDFEMPQMDGLETLKELKKVDSDVLAIMVSAHTHSGAKITLKALEEGAFDFIAKPDGSSLEENKQTLLRQLKPVVNGLITKKTLSGILNKKTPLKREKTKISAQKTSSVVPTVSSRRPGVIKIIAIGISTGGPTALAEVIPKLPELKVPVVIVQHMPPIFTEALAESLDRKSILTVVEGKDNEKLEPGKVYIAPGGKQMKVVSLGADLLLKVTDDPPENHCRPAVDYLFRSLSNKFSNNALGIIMTGMGSDGTVGAKLMKRKGSFIIAQDEGSCVVFGMPAEAIKAGVVDEVVPLNRMADAILNRL
jgi:two-component system, chemotaxis family, protein-glutamate methylesterase/glutaminase